jgi:hypothetical protein
LDLAGKIWVWLGSSLVLAYINNSVIKNHHILTGAKLNIILSFQGFADNNVSHDSLNLKKILTSNNNV